jgi:hypothetical protein
VFFIAGLTSRIKALASGQFFCPTEQSTRHYQHLQERRWFTLFFIPLIPLGGQREWVQCEGCGTTYGTGVIQQHPAPYQQ